MILWNGIPAALQHVKHPDFHIFVEAQGACGGIPIDFRHIYGKVRVVLERKHFHHLSTQFGVLKEGMDRVRKGAVLHRDKGLKIICKVCIV